MRKCYVKAYYDWIEQTAALSDAERGDYLSPYWNTRGQVLSQNSTGERAFCFRYSEPH